MNHSDNAGQAHVQDVLQHCIISVGQMWQSVDGGRKLLRGGGQVVACKAPALGVVAGARLWARNSDEHESVKDDGAPHLHIN